MAEVRIATYNIHRCRGMPESPDISPDGKTVAFAGLRNAVADIFTIDLESGEIKDITNDQFGDYGPTWTPDGKSIIYIARVSGNDKLFRVDLAHPEKKTQLTFGTHDDGAAQFVDADTIVFPSTAVDPNQPINPEVSKNGNIYNIWTLNLKSNELKQYTDALGGNVSPVVFKDEDKAQRVGFITYYKGEYGIHTVGAQKEPLHTVASADFGSPGPIVDFVPPISHTLVKANQRAKGRFEKLFLEGRPPVNVGVTSGGDIFGGTAVTFTDVLGDQQFNIYAESVSQYRTLSFSYTNLSRRLQYALQGFSQTQFYYANNAGTFYAAQYGFLSHVPRVVLGDVAAGEPVRVPRGSAVGESRSRHAVRVVRAGPAVEEAPARLPGRADPVGLRRLRPPLRDLRQSADRRAAGVSVPDLAAA